MGQLDGPVRGGKSQTLEVEAIGLGKVFETESELAAVVVEWLMVQGWEVHYEVSFGYAGIRADIMARSGRLVWVVETKLSLSLNLLEQAAEWRGWANFVSIAVPHSRHRKRGLFLGKVLDFTGVGLLNVRGKNAVHDVETHRRPRLNRKIVKGRLLELLKVHKNYVPAGTPDGGYWTPFRETGRELRRFVEKNPGCTMKQAVDGIEHHYSKDKTAVSCLRDHVGSGVIEGIRVEEEGRAWRLFPEEKKDTE